MIKESALIALGVAERRTYREAVDDDLNHSDLSVAVRHVRLALTAIAATTRAHPNVPNQPLPRSKALVLERLDSDAADWIEASEDWEALGEAFFIRAVTSLLKGASAAACELDGLYEVTSEEL